MVKVFIVNVRQDSQKQLEEPGEEREREKQIGNGEHTGHSQG